MSALNGHERYGRAALDDELATLAGTARGRNHAANVASFKIGGLTSAGALERKDVEPLLFQAAEKNGSVAKHGVEAMRRTIKSGLDAGEKQPRVPPPTFRSNGSAPKPQPAARPQEPAWPAPKLDDGDFPVWTEQVDGKPVFFAIGLAEPRPMPGEVRRHLYRRGTELVRIKIKREGGWIDLYRVRRTTDDAVGWQAKRPVGFRQVAYIGPATAFDPFDREHAGEVVAWVEGEKDVDAAQAAGLLAFSYGSASDKTDPGDLLRGRDIVVVADNDPPGEKAAVWKAEVALRSASRVRVVRFADLAPGADLSDFLEAGGTVEALLERAKDVEAETPKSEEPGPDRFEDTGSTSQASTAPSLTDLLTWYGDKAPEPPPWLVRDLVPRSQLVIIAGQYGAGKTFAANDLAACVMLGVPFAGREVVEQGAVLWLAAEGASEVDVRIKAAATERNGSDPGLLPFARQSFDVPRLTAPDAEEQLLRLAAAFKEGLRVRFPGRDLVMIVIDTLGSAAGWADANSSSEAQAVMNMLRRVNVKTGALILVIDHYGKIAETGVMGASAKPQSAEAILAVLSDRDMAGNHSNRRMAVAKLRSGASGAETAFKLRPVPIDENGGMTCIMDWSSTLDAPVVSSKKSGTAWTPKLRPFKGCALRILLDHGVVKRPFGAEGPDVRAVTVEKVREEFIASYAADSHDAKKKQWNRSLKEALERELIATRDLGIGDIQEDWLWMTSKGAGSDE